MGIGGVALGVSPFLTWLRVFLLGNLNLFQLLQAAGKSQLLAWGAVVAGGAAAWIAWDTKDPANPRDVGLGVGLGAGALALWALLGLSHDVREAQGLAEVAYGPWVALLGCAALVVGGLMDSRLKRSSPPPPPRQ